MCDDDIYNLLMQCDNTDCGHAFRSISEQVVCPSCGDTANAPSIGEFEITKLINAIEGMDDDFDFVELDMALDELWWWFDWDSKECLQACWRALQPGNHSPKIKIALNIFERDFKYAV